MIIGCCYLCLPLKIIGNLIIRSCNIALRIHQNTKPDTDDIIPVSNIPCCDVLGSIGHRIGGIGIFTVQQLYIFHSRYNCSLDKRGTILRQGTTKKRVILNKI